jgi:hypothetical protein
VRLSAKKSLLIQKGGFLFPLLTSILPIVASVIFRSQSTWREKHIMLRKVALDSDTLLSDLGGGLRPVHGFLTGDVTVNLSNKHFFINGNGR